MKPKYRNVATAERLRELLNYDPETGNNQCGYKGVITLQNGSYVARIGLRKKSIFLGQFRNPQDASLVYQIAAPLYHGEFVYLDKSE